jgi:C1A family cysteine protease
MKNLTVYAVSFLAISLIGACKKDTTTPQGKYNTGYNIGTENQSKIPKALNTRILAGTAAAALPSSYFLYKYLPPVGDQGQYGTCVGWATAYYMKTALEAVNKNYSTADLGMPSNQLSPKDLFTAVPDASKGQNCQGTNFEAALTVMQTRGVATQATVPYTGLSSCSQSTLDPSWATDAANHKIATFRAISHTSLNDYLTDIKENLVSNNPVVVGVGIGAGFQNWTGSGVMSAGFDPCGGGNACGGHAQCIVGYDDAKGAGGAFRIVNSWNGTWGDNGFFWVDYNFFFNTLLSKDNDGKLCVFVANNGTSNVTPPGPNPSPSSGVDLAAWVQSDVNSATVSSPTARTATFNIYNIGTATATAAADWGLYYVYYNAYDANDYGVIFYDAFNTSIPANTLGCNPSGNQCVVNYDIPSGNDLSSSVFSTSMVTQTYAMPKITGNYYLILVADAGQKLKDVNYGNNLFYTSNYATPFINGVFKRQVEGIAADFGNTTKPSRETLVKSRYNTAVDAEHLNAYTPSEILAFIKHKKATGELDAKVNAYLNNTSKNAGLTK